MQVTFLTRRTDHQLSSPLITVLVPEQYNLHTHLLKDGKSRINSPWSYTDWYVVSHDLETRGEPVGGQMLLSAFCVDGENVLVIDNTSVNNNEIFDPQTLKRCFFLAHNADFEARWGCTNNFLPGRYGCTMVNDKRLLSGQKGFKFDIISVINRRLGYKQIPSWMEKDIRKEFATCEFFTDDHILYNAADTLKLLPLYLKQLEEAQKLNQLFLYGCLNSRLIIPGAKAETTGIKFDSERWSNIAKDRKEKADKICQELDRIVLEEYKLIPGTINPLIKKKEEQQSKKLERNQSRKLKLEGTLKQLELKGKTHLKSYKVSFEQLRKLEIELTQTATEQTIPKDGSLINWGSNKQVLKVLEQIGCPAPIAKDKKTKKDKEGVGKEARINWFVGNSGSPFESFMLLFDDFKKTEHNIKSFGENWLKQYVRNGRAYTLLDQAGTATGRYSSGDKNKIKSKKLYANIQQIPVRGGKQYRECFLADDDKLMVIGDYENQEGVIMAAVTRDPMLAELTKMKDQHSFVGTQAYRNMYKHRYERTGDEEALRLSKEYVMNKSTPEKDKERDIYKNSVGIFPSMYGASPNKGAATAKVTVGEAQVLINTIKELAPIAVQVLDHKSRVASTDGYVIHNDRTGSRRWFTPVLDQIKYNYKLSKEEKVDAEMEARNSPIQGSGSDIMKEAIVSIELYSNITKQIIRMLLTAHDEWGGDIDKDKPYLADKIKELMQRAAKRYLLPNIDMKSDVRTANHWKK